ncbi:Uma2 family endonuclease [Streptomyces abikoensis]|uniref:Uma2 family endonuclease n=1 Tax=Streptomyces abikoensis TaxID=97398 RepID=UPI0033ED93E3
MGAVMAAEARHEQPERATPENWMYPPGDGWTYDQVKELVLPFDWELVDGNIVVRGATKWWHAEVRDEIFVRLRAAAHKPFHVNSERWTMVDEYNIPRPDVVVFDRRDLDFRTLECVPVKKVVLVVEVVSPGSRKDDRFMKPGMFAEAGVASYWRVERGEDDIPEVYEYRLDHETGCYSPEPTHHIGSLKSDFPFPVEIDLRSLLED